MRQAYSAGLIAAILLLPALLSLAQQDEPRDLDVTEQVEVRLVLVDTLVLDRAGRTVADLTRDDFELFVDYDPTPIDTLDLSCPSGATEDPRSVPRLGDVRPAVAPDAARRLVLAVDYLHLGQIDRVDLITRMRDMICGAEPAAEEIMVAAITGDLRIEQTFSGNRQEILDTLNRMENDISLWLPAFDHLHELRFFRSLEQLIDLLGLVPGSKAVVLFSNLPGPSASYDLAFESIASKATQSRVAFYPVLARGLSTVSSPRLARLAVETGGRFTENTNDLSLGYARAQRDLTCRYVLGFYDENPGRGKDRRVSVRVLRPGVRAIHSNSYKFPTPDEERDSRLRSALLAPGMFQDAAIKTGYYPIRPLGARRWEGLLALEFPVSDESWNAGDPVRDLAASLRRGNHVTETFTRHFALRATGDGTKPPRAIYVQHVAARPGEYVLNAAVSDPDKPTPDAASVSFSLPSIPRDEVFIVPPTLGRRPSRGIQFHGVDHEPGSWDAPDLPVPNFVPLLAPSVERSEQLVVVTHMCRNNARQSPIDAFVERKLRTVGGRLILTLPPTAPPALSKDRIACAAIVDDLPVELPAGDYVFEVVLVQGELRLEERLSFSLTPEPQLRE